MRFVSYKNNREEVRLGVLVHDNIVDVNKVSRGELPSNIISFLELGEQGLEKLKDLIENEVKIEDCEALSDVSLVAPISRPTSVRDFYAFEEHVKTARKKRGLEVVPDWYEIPVFYFTNHLAIKGPDESIERPSDCHWLDYELEVACIIGKQGRDIKKEEAEDYIFGFCIMNDWSARDLQRKEMKVGLGPAKGKDFATSLGPYIVTKDELEPLKSGKGYNLKMIAKVNDRVLSEGNCADIYYSFAEMIERASKNVTLYPGELIGSGTVGTGCILELGTEVHRWLEPGDEVELEIDHLGVLKNTIVDSRGGRV